MVGTRTRLAALVMAGLVSSALVAPGLAFAQDGPTTQAECLKAEGTWVDGKCELPATPDPASSVPSEENTPTTPGTGSTSPTGQSGTVTPGTATTGAGETESSGAQETTGNGAQNPSDPATPTKNTGSVDSTTSNPANADAAAKGTEAIKDAVDEATAGQGALPVNPLAALPIGDLLGGITIPTEVPTGGFTNPQEGCAFLASQVPAPTDAAAAKALAEQIAGFCKALPTDFTDGLGSITDLIDQLTELLKGLIPSLPTPGATTPTTVPANTPDWAAGYWWKGFDVDCGDLTYEEANTILALDPSDRFRLDGDNDGIACERNANKVVCADDSVVNVADYDGYPVGGVSTGDSDGAADTAKAGGLALALLMTSGATAGLRRRVLDDDTGSEV